MNDMILNAFAMVLTVFSLATSSIALIMLGAKSNLLEELAIESLRKGKAIGNKRQSSRRANRFDHLLRVFDVTVTAISLVSVFPIIAVAILGMRALREENVIRKDGIIGKKGKCVRLYRINTVVGKGKDNSALISYKRFLHRLSLDEFLILFNVLKGDLSLFGLARIPYSEKQMLERAYPNLLEQYSKYRPGIVSMFTFEKRINRGKKSQNETMQDIEFTNNVFLHNRSLGLVVKMIAATTISVIRA